jgi:predicted Na+-dependent transporter
MGLFAQVGSSILLFCLVFGMSATVELKQLRKQIQNRKALAIGMALQFIILPFCGFVVVRCLHLPATMGVTLMVVTSSPGGSYSNLWCSLFNAELALSVTMTAISTLLSAVMLPANLLLYTRWTYSDAVVRSLDWFALFLELVVVIGGIACGLLTSARAKKMGNEALFHRRANLCGNIAGLALITLSITLNATGSDTQASLWNQSAVFYIGVALPGILGLTIATYLATKADLEKPERVAVAVEACYQNTGIATSVAISMFSGNSQDLATAIGVPLYYGIVEAVMLAIYCTLCWKKGWTKAPASENFLAMLWNSYEVEVLELQQQENAIEAIIGEGDMKQAPLDLVFEQADDGSAFVGKYNCPIISKKFTPERPQRPKTPGSGVITNGSGSNYEEINLTASSRSLRNRDYSSAPISSPTPTVASSFDGEDTISRASQDEDSGEACELEESRLQKATHKIRRHIQGYQQPPAEPTSHQRIVPSVLGEMEISLNNDRIPPDGEPEQVEKTID